MMANTFTYSAAGEIKALTEIVTGENIVCHLYTACATAGGQPLPASIVGDFTEATFTGYSSKTLTGTVSGTTWSTPTGTPATSQYNSASPQSWTATGSFQTILGYYYVGATSGTFYGAQSFASAVVQSSGQPGMTLVPGLSQGTLPVATS
jgi:hypothetical protein